MNIGFPGGTYDQLFYVADVQTNGGLSGREDMIVCILHHAFCFILPVRTTGRHRIIGIVPDEVSKNRDAVSFHEILPYVKQMIDIQVVQVNWFSTYTVHHQIADCFQTERVLLLGDAGHIHTPTGGQGMNTGIGDAMNAGWKLAAFVKKRAGREVLQSYQGERRAFARQLVATTDKLFTFMVQQNRFGTLLRKTVPSVLPLFLQQHGIRQTLFNTISQVKVSYESSRMSEGKAGKVRSGQRLPWVGGETEDNHAPLASMDWQVHLYGKAAPAVIKFLPFPVHEFTWSRAAYKKGLKENVLYLIRPDGHIACKAKAEHPEILTNYIEKWKLQLIQGEP